MTEIARPCEDAPPDDPLQGTAYRAIRRIGAGAMGQVLEAEHEGLRRRVAVKLLSPSLAGNPGFVDRLRLEAQALATVQHPNVVVVHDHAMTPAGIPFLVMELLHGRTLQDLLRERRVLPLAEVIPLADQVLSGLGAIHARGLTHRDLKPANIFLCEEGGRTVVKLLDFGIVKVTEPRQAGGLSPLHFPTEQGRAIGTPRFMAPEQIMSRGCDARTDIYATGILLYLLLSGSDPFHHHQTQVAVLTAQVMEVPPPLSSLVSVPPAVDAVIARALSKDPAHRFSSAADFARALAAAAHRALPATVTEKIASATFQPREPRTEARATEPIEAGVFRSPSPVLPFRGGGLVEPPPESPRPRAPAAVSTAPDTAPLRSPPSFGLPPQEVKSNAGVSRAARLSVPPIPSVPRREARAPWMLETRLFLAFVALVWCLLGIVVWRALS